LYRVFGPMELSAVERYTTHDTNSVRGGPVLAPAPSALRGYSIRQGHTGDKLRNL
jgi:hypothetical protein